MNNAYISLIAGLLGAIIGSLTSIVTMIIQSRIQDKKQRIQTITELAIQDFKITYDIAYNVHKETGEGFSSYPLVAYLHYYMKLFELIEKEKLNSEELAKIHDEHKRILQIIEENSLVEKK